MPRHLGAGADGGHVRALEERPHRVPGPGRACGASGARGPFQPNTAGVALRVTDVAAAVDEVRAAGAHVIGIEDTCVCHMGFVKDPDGNVLILHRRYASRG